jgi:hypothetical protein
MDGEQTRGDSATHHLLVLVTLLFVPMSLLHAQDEDKSSATTYDWAATAYVAKRTGDSFDEVLSGDADFSNNKIWVLALSRRVATFRWDIDLEVEGQLGKHSGVDTNWEVNGLADLRWNRFFWDRYLDTSAALGLGLSYASEKPEFEIMEQGATNRLMAYVLFELAFSLPTYPQWALVARWHHRSAAWGTFEDDIETASNAIGLGLKYRF